MNFESQTKNGKCTAKAEGELTIYCAAAFGEKITECVNTAEAVELNLDKVEEIDTSCLQLLMQAKRACDASNKTFALTSVSPVIQDVLHLYGLDLFFGSDLNVVNR
ncbi:MAG: STAS domain-containing protein [Gammaproteobacteria bacterium]|nr:STAS domain-containing protein [Gammaproteobacteria bacterium]MDH5651427.1 STAS domain-containing protein [Gammaproteobacteria bacterium]